MLAASSTNLINLILQGFHSRVQLSFPLNHIAQGNRWNTGAFAAVTDIQLVRDFMDNPIETR